MQKVVKCIDCFKSVSVPTRLAIYNFLNSPSERSEATVSEVVDHIGLRQPTISYHLKEMKEAGLLVSRRMGKEVYYSVSKMCPHYNQECVLSGLVFPAKSA